MPAEGFQVSLDGVKDLHRKGKSRRIISQPCQGCPGYGDFEVIFSVRAQAPGHIILEEAQALLRFVRCVLRSRTRFSRRLVVLLASPVIIGAVVKGRSPSYPLNHLIRQLCALI